MSNLKRLLVLIIAIALIFCNITYAATNTIVSADDDSGETSMNVSSDTDNDTDDEATSDDDESSYDDTDYSSSSDDDDEADSYDFGADEPENTVKSQSSTNAGSTSPGSTTTSGLENSSLTTLIGLSIILIAIGAILIFLSIAIIIRMRHL